MTEIAAWLDLSVSGFWSLAVITVLAGIVRGFTGFALSALVMASAALLLTPIELIPMLWWMELVASLMMLRGGWAEADRRIAFGLILGSAAGLPIGLTLTLSVSPDASRLMALIVIATLAALQLSRMKLPALATRPGLYGAGLTAGIVTGIAGVGGMIVALYVLVQDRPARVMRASLVLFLFGTSVISMISHLAFGVMDQLAVYRGLVFAVPTAAGVIVGKLLFQPSRERYYKPACLGLLIGLGLVGILRLLL